MVKIQNVAHNIPIINVWYAKERINDNGIIHYRQSLFKPDDSYEEFVTVENDLTLSEEDIISGISKNGRYEIRRAERENVKTVLKRAGEICEEDIEEFILFFKEFWSSKGVEFDSEENLKNELLQYNSIDALAIGIASIEDKRCVYHTYIEDKSQVRLLHSASLFRTNEDVPKSTLGMANRLLHKDEMLAFKQIGKLVYDWGGAGTTEDVIGITEFKKSFGGEEKIYYDFDDVCGIKAKAVSALSELKSKIKRG